MLNHFSSKAHSRISTLEWWLFETPLGLVLGGIFVIAIGMAFTAGANNTSFIPSSLEGMAILFSAFTYLTLQYSDKVKAEKKAALTAVIEIRKTYTKWLSTRHDIELILSRTAYTDICMGHVHRQRDIQGRIVNAISTSRSSLVYDGDLEPIRNGEKDIICDTHGLHLHLKVDNDDKPITDSREHPRARNIDVPRVRGIPNSGILIMNNPGDIITDSIGRPITSATHGREIMSLPIINDELRKKLADFSIEHYGNILGIDRRFLELRYRVLMAPKNAKLPGYPPDRSSKLPSDKEINTIVLQQVNKVNTCGKEEEFVNVYLYERKAFPIIFNTTTQEDIKIKCETDPAQFYAQLEYKTQVRLSELHMRGLPSFPWFSSLFGENFKHVKYKAKHKEWIEYLLAKCDCPKDFFVAIRKYQFGCKKALLACDRYINERENIREVFAYYIAFERLVAEVQKALSVFPARRDYVQLEATLFTAIARSQADFKFIKELRIEVLFKDISDIFLMTSEHEWETWKQGLPLRIREREYKLFSDKVTSSPLIFSQFVSVKASARQPSRDNPPERNANAPERGDVVNARRDDDDVPPRPPGTLAQPLPIAEDVVSPPRPQASRPLLSYEQMHAADIIRNADAHPGETQEQCGFSIPYQQIRVLTDGCQLLMSPDRRYYLRSQTPGGMDYVPCNSEGSFLSAPTTPHHSTTSAAPPASIPRPLTTTFNNTVRHRRSHSNDSIRVDRMLHMEITASRQCRQFMPTTGQPVMFSGGPFSSPCGPLVPSPPDPRFTAVATIPLASPTSAPLGSGLRFIPPVYSNGMAPLGALALSQDQETAICCGIPVPGANISARL